LYKHNDKSKSKLVFEEFTINKKENQFLQQLIKQLNNNKLKLDECKQLLAKANFLVPKLCCGDYICKQLSGKIPLVKKYYINTKYRI
jgi:hypothetical protein